MRWRSRNRPPRTSIALGAVEEMVGSAADIGGAIVEAAGEGAGGCAEGCGGCATAIVVGMTSVGIYAVLQGLSLLA